MFHSHTSKTRRTSDCCHKKISIGLDCRGAAAPPRCKCMSWRHDARADCSRFLWSWKPWMTRVLPPWPHLCKGRCAGGGRLWLRQAGQPGPRQYSKLANSAWVTSALENHTHGRKNSMAINATDTSVRHSHFRSRSAFHCDKLWLSHESCVLAVMKKLRDEYYARQLQVP